MISKAEQYRQAYKAMQATTGLRFRKITAGKKDKYFLQQYFVSPFEEEEGEWRDVPVIEEAANGAESHTRQTDLPELTEGALLDMTRICGPYQRTMMDRIRAVHERAVQETLRRMTRPELELPELTKEEADT